MEDRQPTRFEWRVWIGFGVVFAVLVASFIWEVSADQAAKREAARQHAHQYAHDAKRRVTDVCRKHTGQAFMECAVETIQATRQDQRNEYDLAAQQEAADWALGMLLLSLGAVIISGLGLLALVRTVRQGREGLDQARMDGAEQARSLQESVREAARSAAAMERVAEAMAINAQQVVESVEISRVMADQQKLFGKLQMRAYVNVLIGGGLYQTEHLRFQAEPFLTNSGNTAAANVRWKIAADVLPVPLPADFRFPLPAEVGGGSILGAQQSGNLTAVVPDRVDDAEIADVKAGVGKALYVWGCLAYEDAFNRTHRCTFAQQLYWLQAGPGREDGWMPEQVRGLYLAKHNRSN